MNSFVSNNITFLKTSLMLWEMYFPSFSASSTSFWRNFKNCTANSIHCFCRVHFILGEKCTSWKNEHSTVTTTTSRMEEEIGIWRKIFRALVEIRKSNNSAQKEEKAFFLLNVHKSEMKWKLVRSLCHLSCQTSIEPGLKACTLLNSYFNLSSRGKIENFKRYELVLKLLCRKIFDFWEHA